VWALSTKLLDPKKKNYKPNLLNLNKTKFLKQMLTYPKTSDNIWINNEGSRFYDLKENIEFALIQKWTGFGKVWYIL